MKLGSTTNSRLDSSQGEAESSNCVRPSGKMLGYAFQGADGGGRESGLQGYETKLNEESVQSEQPEPRSAASGQDLAARVTVRHPPKNMDTKSSTSVAPTYAVAIGKTGLQDKHSFETGEDESSAILRDNKERSAERIEQASLFAKRPVQPVKSASALFGNPIRQSNDTLSRSKSQLTLLLEKDRAKDKQDKGGHDTASKANDAKPR